MAEPEDLILDGAYVASRFARRVWQRYGAPPPDDALRLSDVRLRLELFLNALFGFSIPVSTAEPAAPVSWLGRIAARGGSERRMLPATDGARVYLPPSLAAETAATGTYELLAVAQAVRVARGTAAVAGAISSERVRNRFLFAEAAAVDSWIVSHTPGLVPQLREARRAALATGPASLRRAGAAGIYASVAAYLRSEPGDRSTPVFATPHASLEWASAPASGDSSRREPPLPPVFYWGQVLPMAAAVTAREYGRQDVPGRGSHPRVADMRRRPRVREAAEDEDDDNAGMWIVRPDEPQESVEDPFGLQRPADQAKDADPEDLGDSLSDLPEARLVRTPAEPREVLRAGDEHPRAIRPPSEGGKGLGIAYPEWDYQRRAYKRPGALVYEAAVPEGDADWVRGARVRHARLIRRVRRRFERLRPRRVRTGRQPDGPELDIAEYVRSAADARAGAVAGDRLYEHLRRARRELSVALLVDLSASTDAWVTGDQRIVDVEKDALVVVSEALGALGDSYAIYAFWSQGPEHVGVLRIKSFGDPEGERTGARIAALDANGYTRIGAAIRHVTVALGRQPSERRLLLVLSDGKPNDIDAYDGPYGIEDTRQAVAEARAERVDVFCLTVDREAPRYAARIFGRAGFSVLRHADHLPQVLVDVLRRLIAP